MQNEKKALSKTSRILLIFHLFRYCQEVSFKEISDLIPVGRKTIERDIALLQQAGLLDIHYSVRVKAYVPAKGGHMVCFQPPKFPESVPQRQFMEKIIRLATIMRTVKADDDPVVWYHERFPELTSRTMQRDFAELAILGYEIRRQGIIDYDGEHPIGSHYRYFPRDVYGPGEGVAYCLETFRHVPFIAPSHRRGN
jgi:hypothetical protein